MKKITNILVFCFAVFCISGCSSYYENQESKYRIKINDFLNDISQKQDYYLYNRIEYYIEEESYNIKIISIDYSEFQNSEIVDGIMYTFEITQEDYENLDFSNQISFEITEGVISVPLLWRDPVEGNIVLKSRTEHFKILYQTIKRCISSVFEEIEISFGESEYD